MPALDEMPSGDSLKMLIAGPNGSGKTGALASIIINDPEARLFICDFDKMGVQILRPLLSFKPDGTPRPNAKDLMSRVQVVTMQDKLSGVSGVPQVVGTPTAFAALGKAVNKWPEGDFGGYETWGPKDWLVIDSLTAMGDAAMRYTLHMAGRLNKRPYQEDWGDAIGRQTNLIDLLTSANVRANLAILTHIKYVGDTEKGTDDDGEFKEFVAVPTALGQKLPQDIGRFFNNVILVQGVGSGPGTQRKIHTKAIGKFQPKTSSPFNVKPSYGLENGLHELVTDLRR